VPLSCVSVALWRGDEPVIGVVHDFNHDQVFTAIVGSGAWLDGTPIHVTGTRDVRDAVIAIGFRSPPTSSLRRWPRWSSSCAPQEGTDVRYPPRCRSPSSRQARADAY